MNRARMMSDKARIKHLDEAAHRPHRRVVELNNIIASESVEIVRLLPEKLQQKLGVSEPS